MNRVRVINTQHAGLMPGDEGELEGPHLDGYAVKFDCIRGLKKTDQSTATVFMRKGDILMIPEPIEGNPS